ncbi:MAG: DUF1707 domain-containing protein [Streptosporangiaceae bacterium]|nr:DUF1707 domain-containing protein [Streptosporangiaceae bacterium]
MSTQSRQTRARGFSPLFGGGYPDQHLRVSDAERQAVTDRLAEHFGEGRLDQAEFDERVGRAMSAKTRADLSGLFDDLPETGAPAAPELRTRRRHPVLLIVLAVVLAIALGHALWWTAGPLLWLGFLVAVVLLAGRLIGRCAHRQGP